MTLPWGVHWLGPVLPYLAVGLLLIGLFLLTVMISVLVRDLWRAWHHGR